MSLYKPLESDDQRHGTTNGYLNYGCRCEPCRAASSVSQADRRRRLAGSLDSDDSAATYQPTTRPARQGTRLSTPESSGGSAQEPR